MFCAEDDDATLKASVVRPNDVLDIEVSPIAGLPPTCLSTSNDLTKNGAKLKVKEKRVTKGNITKISSPMKRGDPFLPSVFSDENPIADYTIKKNSRKKPSDCKCKGFGYNLSPSALLPEEMKQQWGVGMFGKPSLVKPNTSVSISNTNVPIPTVANNKEGEPKLNQISLNRTSSGCPSSKCVMRCKVCSKDPCLCIDITTTHEGFRVPDSNDRRKQKTTAKPTSFKCKETKSPGPIILGSTNNAPVLKRIACYSSKDNSNIISTSNFNRNNTNSFNGHTPLPSDVNCFKNTIPVQQNSLGGNRCQNLNGNVSCNVKSYCCTSCDDDPRDLAPKARHRPPSMVPKRLLANITPSTMLSNSSMSSSNSSGYDAKKNYSRNAAQMLMLGTQCCKCDSCRRRASLMSRMEALRFSSSHAQQMFSPFLYAASQKYQPVSMQPSLSTPGRYAPYTVPNYGYTRSTGSVYRSPEQYRCSSPSYYDYADIPSIRQPFSTTPLSMVHEINKIDNSYIDSENSLPSPPSAAFVEDITDLSIQDTVDFFVSMKSPFVNSSPSPVSDSSSAAYTSLSPIDRCPTSPPIFNNVPSSCYCSTGMCSSSYSLPHFMREINYSEPPSHKFTTHEATSQPMSLLYSSLASDLEDELQCAIENIPTG
ncbi:uncharacterized protein LOC131953177 [Physella acuta]|uniref:uncharacterized protein LOC131953177 n=1 Tax=Physella acuta TaxID=109671 RepID=UPI0027DC892C|nr:uncharacterized protein LOC131953177 [Physella acuta]